MHFFLTSAILLIFIGLSGCESKYFSSKSKLTNYSIVKNYNAGPKKSFSKTKTVKVKKGDTVYSIAKSNGIAKLKATEGSIPVNFIRDATINWPK